MYPPTGKIPGCKYGYTFGVAFPSNYSDPFLTNWSKSALNPIVNDTFDDPSTAWQTSTGELRWIANCGDGQVGDCGEDGSQAPLYGSADSTFTSSYKIGFTNLKPGECASLYPLPPLSPGTKPTPGMPSHVHKWGCEPYKDCVEIGSWHEGAPGKVGRWEPHPSIPGYRLVDSGAAYACKDFWDEAKKRRINTAWARVQPAAQGSRVNGDVQTLAREIAYHPTLRQLLFSPLADQAALRQVVLGSEQHKVVTQEASLKLGPWPAGNQSDIQISVKIPNEAATLYISLQADVRVKFYVNFQPFSPSSENARNAENAENDYHVVEVGMLSDDPYPSYKDTLRLLNDESLLELRLLLDHTVTEAYWQGGRVAMTVSSPLTNSTSIALSTDTPKSQLHIESITAWRMGSAWTPHSAL